MASMLRSCTMYVGAWKATPQASPPSPEDSTGMGMGSFFLNRVANPTTIYEPVKENPPHLRLHSHSPSSSPPDLPRTTGVEGDTPKAESGECHTITSSILLQKIWKESSVSSAERSQRALSETTQELRFLIRRLSTLQLLAMIFLAILSLTSSLVVIVQHALLAFPCQELRFLIPRLWRHQLLLSSTSYLRALEMLSQERATWVGGVRLFWLVLALWCCAHLCYAVFNLLI
jgi:hypothetical protein